MKIIYLMLLAFLSSFSYSNDFFEQEFEVFSTISTGRNVEASKAASTVSVLDSKYFRDNGFQYIEEAIASVPNIYLQKNTLAQSHSYICRGITSKYNSEVLFMIDNTPIKTLSHGNALSGSWVNMSLDQVDKIEVIRGSGSALYGADAFSCVINISTKNKGDIISSYYNDNDTVNLSFSKEIISDRLFFSVTKEKSDGEDLLFKYDFQSSLDDYFHSTSSLAPEYGNFQYETLDFLVKFNYKKFNFSYLSQTRDNIGTGFGLDRAVDNNGLYKSDRDLFKLNYQINLFKTLETNLNFSTFLFSEKNIKPAYLHPEGSVICLTPNPLECVTYQQGMIGSPEVFEKSSTFYIDNFLSEFSAHLIRFGLGFNNSSIYKTKDTNNFLTVNYLLDVSDTKNIFVPEKDRINKFFYFQDEWEFLGDFSLTTGFRYDSYSDFGDTLNPRISLVWNYNENITNKFIYGKAFRAPSILELYSQSNPVASGSEDLTPETIHSLEYALSFNNHYNIQFYSNIYYHKIFDDIRFIEENYIIKAKNEGSTEGYGIEFELNYLPYDNIKVTPKYNYQYTYDVTNKQKENNVPSHTFLLTLNYEINNNYYLNFSSKYNSDTIYKDKYLNNVKIDNPLIFDASILYKNNNLFETRLSIKNIFNKKQNNIYKSPISELPDLLLPSDERLVSFDLKINI